MQENFIGLRFKLWSTLHQMEFTVDAKNRVFVVFNIFIPFMFLNEFWVRIFMTQLLICIFLLSFFRLRCNVSSNIHRKIFTVFWSMDCNKQSFYSSWYCLSCYLYKFNSNIGQQTSSNWCFGWNASWSNHWIFVCVCCSGTVC